MEPIYMAGPSITEHEIEVVNDAMRNGWYEKPYWYVETFQKGFAAYHGRKYGIMTPNCTTSIHLLLTCLGISDGDEVILPDCTWIATAAPITYLRATPVFCDIEPVNWCLDPESLERCITPRTKAIIVVDLFGNMPVMKEIVAIAEKHGIPLIEDSAEALGSTYEGTRAGNFGVGSVFSFHRTKTLVTGEGGMLLLDDDKLYERCMIWRDHGRKPGGAMYYNYEVTYKYMPFNLQAALGYAQFQRLDELVNKKREIWQMYKERLADVEDIELNAEPEGVYNSVWITALVFGKSHNMSKQDAIARLAEIGVPSRPFFYPLSSLPAYPGLEEKYRPLNPNAYDISARGINLPGALNLTEDQIDFVCDGIKKVVEQSRSALVGASR
ncbi:MAG: DegT/DnrJ/EryC1/StrS family aminotransferase [Verrucomicrobiota bacterium]|nr:DegT/DnrJ/EryC1/StrS family aminotransferase [Verrucomicrobiota bacterium]